MEQVISNTNVSVKQFREMFFDDNDDFFYELIEGKLIKKSANAPWHQIILQKVLIQRETFNRRHKRGLLFPSPLEVFMDGFNKLQPDLLFVSKEREFIIGDEAINGAPDLIVEVISPESMLRDRIEKKNVYERVGVKEFWIVDPKYKSIEIYTIQNDRYELLSAATVLEGELKSDLFEGLVFNINDVFSAVQ